MAFCKNLCIGNLCKNLNVVFAQNTRICYGQCGSNINYLPYYEIPVRSVYRLTCNYATAVPNMNLIGPQFHSEYQYALELCADKWSLLLCFEHYSFSKQYMVPIALQARPIWNFPLHCYRFMDSKHSMMLSYTMVQETINLSNHQLNYQK